jgi:hypothetical protein
VTARRASRTRYNQLPGDPFREEGSMNRPRCSGASGAAVAWIVIAVLVLGILAVIGLSVTIVLPMLRDSRTPEEYEANAVGWLRVINTGEGRYTAACVQGGYAVSLEDLAKAPQTGGSPFVPGEIGTNGVRKDSYRFTVVKSRAAGVADVGTVATTCNGAAATPASGYFASAEPTDPGRKGRRYFATDASGIVYGSDRPIANPIRPSAGIVPIQ